MHLGSLLTALISFLQARYQCGAWLLRIDDLDLARSRAGAEALILRQLEAHGLHWDESPRRQTRHLDEYESLLSELRQRGRIYHCRCTRAVLAQRSLPGPDGDVYAGDCRELESVESEALRLRVGIGAVSFHDRWQGLQSRDLASEVGDFVLRRRDGLIAYQLACAVDEHRQGITEVVRGADLLGSTFRQIHLMDLLSWPRPGYAHLPVLIGLDGCKLSKQNHAESLDAALPADNLRRCLNATSLSIPEALQAAPVSELLSWAIAHWHPEAVPTARCLSAKSL